MLKAIYIRAAICTTILLALVLTSVTFWNDLFYSNLFDLHASCYRWIPSLIILHVGSDFLTGCSYVFISCMLLLLVTRLRMPFQWVFVAFGAFIVACGITHFIEIITTIWVPIYWFAGYVKAITALASVGTAIALPPILPHVTKMVNDARQADKQGKELIMLYTELESSYYALANAMPLLVWVANANGVSQFYNRGWQEYTGYNHAQLLSNEYRSLIFHKEDLPDLLASWSTAMKSKSNFDIEVRIKQHDNTFRWHLLRGMQIVKDGVVIGWISTATDIDRQKYNEQMLREAQERQDTFLSMTSHELKTPLTSMILVTSLFKRELEEKYTKQIIILDRQLQRLASLINDLLDMSRFQSNNLALNFVQFDMRKLVQEAIQMVQPGSTHSVNLMCSDIPVLLSGDRERIEQVIVNLLTNAIKYSPEAKTVDVNVTSSEGSVVCSVRDYGIGIAEEAREHIFERYYRSIGADRHKYSGLGIGLYIASEIVKRHNGHIWVKSEVGHGSTFTFSVPVAQEALPFDA